MESFKNQLAEMRIWKKEVSYLGFTLTQEGIKPGKNKLKANKSFGH
jgi:hypothetical protein